MTGRLDAKGSTMMMMANDDAMHAVPSAATTTEKYTPLFFLLQVNPIGPDLRRS